jgi:hypothetical protein
MVPLQAIASLRRKAVIRQQAHLSPVRKGDVGYVKWERIRRT